MSQSQSLGSLKFAGKVVVITGSGTGIGQAIARRFAREGANIVIMGRRKEPLDQTSKLLEEIIASAGSTGSVTSFPGVDVSDEAGISKMFESLKQQFGKVDIVINNAGVSGPVKSFTNASVQEFRECVAIHLTGTFWTSACALKVMAAGATILTISTFFSEESKYEQRPYRFRTPYTASQGAKNRLAEALAWELASRQVRSIATNPGPVHSDRIYKTVYPKAAAEFLRIGGFPGLSSTEVEKVAAEALPLLGEDEKVFSSGVRKVAEGIVKSRGQDSEEEIRKAVETVSSALNKIQEIAEKIQSNTSKMIVDGEFLSQDDVAEMVVNLCGSKVGKLVNGRVIPNDRVFYPVKPIVGTAVVGTEDASLSGKVVVLTTGSSARKDIERIKTFARLAMSQGAKQVIVLYSNAKDSEEFKEFHSHTFDMLNEDSVRRILRTAKTKFGQVDALIHFTGDYDYTRQLASLARSEWDSLVSTFINAPGLVVKETVNVMTPEGAIAEPSKYKGTNGRIIIVGPDAPVGKKISGEVRARSDVFRGALRPYTATVNQELGDVLSSNIRLYLVLPGNSEGSEPDSKRLYDSLLKLASGSEAKGNEAIYYIDEARP